MPARSTTCKIAGAVILLAMLAVLCLRAMTVGINHDEHQFVAPGFLWAERGLMPYRDFPTFHMPHLVFIYGALGKLTAWKFLADRLFNAVCAWGTVALVFLCARSLFAELRPGARTLPAAGCALLLLTAHLFTKTACKTWNHDFPALATVGAFLLMVHAARTGGLLPVCSAASAAAWPWARG